MAVPKRRVSSTRRDKRRSSVWKMDAPELTKCPKCGEYVDVFVRMGGPIGKTGTLVSSETCVCGHVLPAGSYETDYEQ